MALFDKNANYIRFVKTDASAFAGTIKDTAFAEWLYSADASGNYLNIDGSVGNPSETSTGGFILRQDRNRNYPVLDSSLDPSLYSLYFIDDIKLIYANGVPYDNNGDYVTGCVIDVSSMKQPYVDASSHILHIGSLWFGGTVYIDASGGGSDVSILPITFNYWTGNSTAAVSYDGSQKINILSTIGYNSAQVGGHPAADFTLMGSASDASTAMTFYGLYNYVKTLSAGGGGGSDIDLNWHIDE